MVISRSILDLRQVTYPDRTNASAALAGVRFVGTQLIADLAVQVSPRRTEGPSHECEEGTEQGFTGSKARDTASSHDIAR